MMKLDTAVLLGTNLFAGFSVTGINTDGSISIPAGQTIANNSFFTTTFTVPLPDNKSFSQVEFQLIGPSQSDGNAHDTGKWKLGGGSAAKWFTIDGLSMDIYLDILSVSTSLTLQVQYFNYSGGSLTYNTLVTVNTKAFFFKYPWE